MIILFLFTFISVCHAYSSVSECNNIPDSDEKNICYMQVAENKGDVSICDNIPSSGAYSNVNTNCYTKVGCKTGDISICNEIQKNEPYPYKDECYSCIASNKQDVSVCNKIQKKSLQDSCYRKIGIAKQDPSICDKITEMDSWRNKESCYKEVAIAKQDVSICDKIKDKDIKESCKEDIGFVEVEETDNKISEVMISEPLDESNGINLKKVLPLFYFIVGAIILIIIIFILTKLIRSKRYVRREKVKENIEEPKKRPNQETKRTLSTHISEAISVKNFTVKHGKNIILTDVDFDVKRGELVCLLGPSGTGKSTIIESLVGRKTPTKGDIRIFNTLIKDKRIYHYVGFVPQNAELYMNQTVEQNLLSSAIKWGVKDAKNKVSDILSTVELLQRKDLKANKLSGGQLKLLSLGMELIRDPELLILDEPTTGLDPNTRDNIITILSRIVTKKNKTAFFTTHSMDDAEESDEVIIIAKGKIVAQGAPSKLEKRLPGHGRVVNIILDNVTDDLLKNIEKIEGVEKVVSEGRNLKIIINEPNAIKLGQKIDEIGGVVNKTEIINATMKEVFVYYTGEKPQ